MESKKRKVLKGTLIAGALIGATSLTAAPSAMFNFNDLGSGIDVRTTLLERSQSNSSNLYLELKCGEGKCGEGTCGEEGEAKKATKENAETTKAKAKTKKKAKKTKKTKKTKTV